MSFPEFRCQPVPRTEAGFLAVGAANGQESSDLALGATKQSVEKPWENIMQTDDPEATDNPPGPEEYCILGDLRYAYIQPTNAELAHIRIRVIALEHMLIALLAEASDRQLAVVREMASYILPRPGYTNHPLTVHASVHMNELVERASRFRTTTSS